MPAGTPCGVAKDHKAQLTAGDLASGVLECRYANRHTAEQIHSPESDLPGRAPDKAVRSVGGTAGGSGRVVS